MSVRGKAVQWWVIGVCMSCALALSAFAAIKDADCLECHSDQTLVKTNAAGKEIRLFVDEAKLKNSAHSTNTCASCHADQNDHHPDDNVAAKPVNCHTCHERQTDSYGASVHGLAVQHGDANAPASAFFRTGLRRSASPAVP